MGYSLCMIADFQKALFFRIFRVFWSGFLLRKTLNDLYNGFCNFHFVTKVRILNGL